MQNVTELNTTEAAAVNGGDIGLTIQITVAVTVWAVTTYYNAKAAYQAITAE